MSEKNEDMTLVNEIIDEAEELPPECQRLILSIAKGMEFSRGNISEEKPQTKKPE